MKAIWKYNLAATDEQQLLMPQGAEMLHVDTQTGNPALIILWALVDPEAPPVARVFAVHGTGHPMPDEPGTYIGTVVYPAVGIVWHVFELTE